MLTAFKQYLTTLKLSLVSRKLYLSDVRRFLAYLGSEPSLSLVSSPKSYTSYLDLLRSQAIAPSMLKRTTASLKQLGSFIALTYSLPNPTISLSKPSTINHQSSTDKYITHFTNYLNSAHLSPLTIKSYKSDITRYLDWAGSHLPSTELAEALTDQSIKIYLNHLHDSLSTLPSTIERKDKSLARFKSWYQDNYLPTHLPDNISTFKGQSETNSSHSRSEGLPHSGSVSPDLSSFIVKNINYRTIISLAILLLFTAGLAIFGYRQFSRDVQLTSAFPSTPVTPNRQLSFQGRLENAGGTPVTSATNFVFKLWDAEGAGAGNQLYTTGTCSITPDTDGVFNTQIGDTCGSAITSSVFTENANVFLEVTVAAEVLAPRQQIATVAYALNSETLQGFPISSTVSAIRNTVVPMNQWGEILIGEQSPRLTGISGTFAISAPALSFTTATGTNGNITLAPDGTGQINLNGNTTSTNFFNVANAQLTTGSLITGTAANNNSGFKLLDLLSGSSPTSKFSVTDAGNVTLAGDLTITGGNITSATTFDSTLTTTGTLTANGTLDANGIVTLGDGGEAITIDGSSVAIQTTGAGSDITINAVDQIILTDFTTCTALETTGGVLTCGTDDTGGAGSSNWRSSLGALSPINDTWDLLVGGIATSSAKAGFININLGTPTATVSAGTAGGSFLTANGYLSTTARQSLTLGNSAAYNTTGDILLHPNGTGNVGIGVTNPTSKLQIGGSTSTISNGSGDLTIDSFSGNVVLGTDDDLIPTLGAGSADLGASGTPWDNLYAVVATLTGDLTISQATPSILLTDSGGDDYSVNVDANAFNITNATDSRVELAFDGAGGVDLGDNTATKTIHIGGNTNSAADTINIGTNATAADVIAIGNAHASTTLALTGGAITMSGASVGILTTGTGDITLNSADQIILTDFTTCTALETVAGVLTCGTDGGGNVALTDNTIGAFQIVEGANVYVDITTTDNSETFTLNLPVGGVTLHTANLFNANITQTINLGTGTAADTINIGTGATTADDINIGGLSTSHVDITGILNLAGGTTYKVDASGNATFLDITASDTGNPGLTVGNGSIGYAKIGGSTISDNSGNLTLDSDSAAITFAADDTTLTATGLATLDMAATVGWDVATLNATSLATLDTSASLVLGTTTLTLDSNSTINGGSAADNNLTLQGTSHATRTSSYLILQPTAGNVGIGTATPQGRLDITDTSNTAASLYLVNNTATTLGVGINTIGVIDLQSTSLTTGNFLNIETNALTSGHAVNVTTTSTGLIASSALLNLTATGDPGATWTGDLASIEYATSIDIDIDGNALKVGLTGAGTGEGTALNVTTAQTGTTALALRVNDDGTYADSTPFAVTAAGDVGIGTTAPEQKLQITGGDIYIKDTTAADAQLRVGEDTNITGIFGWNTTSNYLSISTNANTYPIQIDGSELNIMSAGGVGIGNTAPGQALDVTGTIRASTLTNDNGVLYANSSGDILQTATGGAGTLCLISVAGGVPSFGSCSGSASTVWSQLTAPAANLSLAHGTNTTTMTSTATSGTFWTMTANSLTTGTALDINATNTATSNTALAPIRFDLINNQTNLANANISGIRLGWDQNTSVAGNTEAVMRIVVEDVSASTDENVDSLLLLDNAESTNAGIVVDNALKITNSGGQSGGLVDAIDASDADIDNALNAGANFILLNTGMREFGSSATVITWEDTAGGATGNDLMTLTDAGTTGNLAITGDEAIAGSLTLGSIDDASITIDQNLTWAQGTTTWLNTFTGTTTTGNTITANSLTTGTALDINADNTATSNTALAGIRFDLSNSQTNLANAGISGVRLGWNQTTSVAGNTESAFRIVNELNNSATTDTTVDSLLQIDNADTATGSLIAITNGLLITSSGAGTAGIVNGITIGSTTQQITNGLNMGGSTGITTDLILQNSESIDNNMDGVIAMTTTTLDVNGGIQVTLIGTASDEAVCKDGAEDATANVNLTDCTTGVTADYAEQYPIEPNTTYGHIVGISDNTVKSLPTEQDLVIRDLPILNKADITNRAKIIGVISNNYSDFTSTGKKSINPSDNPMPVALVGRVPVFVTNENGPISVGDPITASSLAGYGARATTPGMIIGRALESSSPNSETDEILVFVNTAYYDNNIALSDSGDLNIISTSPGNYAVNTPSGLATKIEAFASATIARITAGLTRTNELAVATISPLSPGESIAITGPVTISPNLANLPNTANSPALTINGELDAATISARVALLTDIQADTITARNIVADTISANHIEGLDAKIATLSGELSDSELTSITDRIKARLEALTGNLPDASDLPVPPEASNSANLPNLPNPANSDFVATDSATLTSLDADFVTINHYLAVIGQATITDLEITSHLYTDSITSKTGHLALGDNTLLIDSLGQVAINGDLTVSGQILADSAQLNSLSLGSPNLANSANQANSSELGKLLSIYNEAGVAVATIDASGSANLASLTTNMITIASAGDATSSSLLASSISTNATAGESVLVAPNTELTIESPFITPNSLVYLTPTGHTGGKVVFVKSKTSCPPLIPNSSDLIPPCTPSFTVGIDAPTSSDISFNWWIIQLAPSTLLTN